MVEPPGPENHIQLANDQGSISSIKSGWEKNPVCDCYSVNW